MNEGILGQIANPMLADVAGALDYRRSQMDKDEAKRKELRMNQLIAQAIPNMAADSPIRKIFEEDPKTGAMISKAVGIPLNDGEAWEKFRGNVAQLHSIAKADPRMAIERANAMKAENDRLGIVDKQLDSWVGNVNSAMEKGDQDGVITQFNALGVMNDNLNPVKADVISAEKQAELDLKRDELNWKKSRPQSEADGGATAHAKNLAVYKQMVKNNDPDAERFAYMVGLSGRDVQSKIEEAGGVQGAKERAKSKVEREDISIQNSTAFDTYNTAMGGLIGGLDKTDTGYFAGRLPTITANQQIAEGAVAAIAPILKATFRTAGEGTFTDKDQDLLMAMVPTRKDLPEARAEKINNINKIIAAKLGKAEQEKGLSGQDKQAYDWAKSNPNDPRAVQIMQRLGVN